jgi:two-component system cell cycle sensor histidine kinase/response regulator CckA
MQTRWDAATAQVFGERSLLENAILNVCANAKDAMPNGGILTLQTRLEAIQADQTVLFQMGEGPAIVLTVSDTGIGMSPDVLAHVCEPFFSTHPKDKTSGFGLATVYGVMRQHGGHLEFTTCPDEGTSCAMWFPLMGAGARDPQAIKANAPPPPSANAGQGETILFVDDEKEVLGVVERQLTRNGYRVLTAENGEKGLQILLENPDAIDLIISDIQMPTMDGVTMVEKMKEALPNPPPFIFFSGYASEIERVQKSGACRIFSKPAEMSVLLSALREILTSR